MRALPGQKFEDGSPISEDMNISAEKEIRSAYPMGTVFALGTLKGAAGFYDAGANPIYPVGISPSDYVKTEHVPSDDVRRAYEEFIGLRPATSPDDLDDYVDEEPRKPKASAKATLLSRMVINPKLAVPTVKDDGFYVDVNDWYLLLRNIQNQVNTLMIGPTGTGKTELVMLACKKLGIPCAIYDMGSMYDPVAGLLGVHRLQKGGSVFDYAKFTEDISKPGVVLLDELSRAPVTTNNILFPCLDSRRRLPVEIAGGDDVRSIEVHAECCFVATANIGAEYTGTMSMDRALVGRFFPVELAYLPSKIEEDILVKRCGVLKTDASMIVKLANDIRKLFEKQELSHCVSTRETLMVGDLITDGWPLVKALDLIILPLFEGSGSSDSERGIVKKLFMVR